MDPEGGTPPTAHGFSCSGWVSRRLSFCGTKFVSVNFFTENTFLGSLFGLSKERKGVSGDGAGFLFRALVGKLKFRTQLRISRKINWETIC